MRPEGGQSDSAAVDSWFAHGLAQLLLNGEVLARERFVDLDKSMSPRLNRQPQAPFELQAQADAHNFRRHARRRPRKRLTERARFEFASGLFVCDDEGARRRQCPTRCLRSQNVFENAGLSWQAFNRWSGRR